MAMSPTITLTGTYNKDDAVTTIGASGPPVQLVLLVQLCQALIFKDHCFFQVLMKDCII